MAIAVKIVTANFTKCVKSLQCKLKVFFFLKKLLVFSESFYFTFQEETTYLIDKKEEAFKLSQMSLIAMQVKLF